MPVNPFTAQPWTTDDFEAATYQIGVKVDVGSTLGLSVGDIVLDCVP
jgi:hypothetical protein